MKYLKTIMASAALSALSTHATAGQGSVIETNIFEQTYRNPENPTRDNGYNFAICTDSRGSFAWDGTRRQERMRFEQVTVDGRTGISFVNSDEVEVFIEVVSGQVRSVAARYQQNDWTDFEIENTRATTNCPD